MKIRKDLEKLKKKRKKKEHGMIVLKKLKS